MTAQEKPIPNPNMALWLKVAVTDATFTKKFDKGTFKGTDINPTYRAMKMTELFGPYGKGWGVQNVQFRETPTGKPGEVGLICTLEVWYMDAETGNRCVAGPHTGADYMIRATKGGDLRFDDESFKKAQTDAMTAAFRFIGISADVYMGLWDNSKYQAGLSDGKAGEYFGVDMRESADAWDIDALSRFEAILDRAYDAFKAGGAPGEYDKFRKAWKECRASGKDPAETVLTAMAAAVHKLEEAAKKKAQGDHTVNP